MSSVARVRCPDCSALDDKVVDSRASDDGSAIRRRRACLGCGHRFTTFERVEEAPLVVLKTTGERQPFDRDKVASGVVAAVKNRPVTEEQIDALVTGVEDAMRRRGGEVESTRVGLAVLERLRELDDVAYLRFASVYKDFTRVEDFADELRLLTKGSGRPEG
ncbi:MAG TPA: transcriptional regulator NrdR [Acidimicrobiales bacterium]|nr:transcriptional regulator NrdR [Acidimicrobiales bacterium]